MRDFECTCRNFKHGEICEHIIATCYEIINQHNASTKEGQLRLAEQRRKALEERRKEEEKRREYERKYYMALHTLDTYKDREKEFLNKNITNTTELKDFYNETMLNQLSDKDA